MKIARWLCILALAAFAGLSLFIVFSRINWPYELEWTTGAMLDHVERVRDGKPLYVAPSAEWTPFLYPPVWYWVCAAVSKVVPGVLACRLVSLFSTLGTAATIFAICGRLGTTRFSSIAAALLYVGCFGFTLQWYDIERCDSLFVLLLALSAWALLSSHRLAPLAGAILGIAFFVKQPASTFIVLVPIVLAALKKRKEALAMIGGTLAIAIPLYAYIAKGTGGWFWFYCFGLPAAHGMEPKYFTLFFVSDLSKALVLTLATGVAIFHATRDRDPKLATFAAYLGAGFVAAASSRMHNGGWPNVLMFWTAFACPAVGWAIDKISSPVVLAAVALQAGAFAPDPNESIPGKKDTAYAEALASRVKQLELGGEVLVLGRGHMTKNRHAHHNALLDAVHAGQPFPDDIVHSKFHAILLDDPARWDLEGMPEEEGRLIVLLGKNYFIAERLDDRRPAPVVGYPTMPRWVLRKRETPLAGSDADIWRRLRIEAGFAERNMRAAQASSDAWSEGLDIEQLAERADRN